MFYKQLHIQIRIFLEDIFTFFQHNIFIGSLGISYTTWSHSFPSPSMPTPLRHPHNKTTTKKLQFWLSIYSLKCGQTFSGLLLRKKWVLLPRPYQKPLAVKNSSSASLSCFLGVLFNDVLFRMLLGLVGVVMVVTEIFHVPLSHLCICSYQHHCKSNFLALCSPRTAQIVCFHLVSSNSTDQEHTGCSRTTDPEEALAATWTTDVNATSGGSTDYGHSEGLQ